MEKGTRRLTDEWMTKLASALEVSPIDLMAHAPHDSILLRGEIRANECREQPYWAPQEERPVSWPGDARYDASHVYALTVADDSAAARYPQGSILMLVPLAAINHIPAAGRRYVIREWQDHCSILSVRRLEIAPDGKHWLEFDTENPEYKARALCLENAETKVQFEALVIGAYIPE